MYCGTVTKKSDDRQRRCEWVAKTNGDANTYADAFRRVRHKYANSYTRLMRVAFFARQMIDTVVRPWWLVKNLLVNSCVYIVSVYWTIIEHRNTPTPELRTSPSQRVLDHQVQITMIICQCLLGLPNANHEATFVNLRDSSPLPRFSAR